MTQIASSNLQLLVSVRDVAELEAARAGGADWIDLKEPKAGPLAAVDQPTAIAAADALAGTHMLSAALGELVDWQTSSSAKLLAVSSIGVVKLGLAGCANLDDWRERWLAVAAKAKSSHKQLVAVIYADWQQAAAPSPTEVLSLATEAGSRYLLIDTYAKQGNSVFDCLTSRELVEILQIAKQSALTTVLAGSLTLECVEQLPPNLVDIVAVRGAVCRGDRTATVDAALVAQFRQALTDHMTLAKGSTSLMGL